MNTTAPLADRSDYAKLAFAPLGLLLVATVFFRVTAAAAGPSAMVLAVDLLALAMGALVGWLGGEFAVSREVPAEHGRTWRPRAWARLTHKAA